MPAASPAPDTPSSATRPDPPHGLIARAAASPYGRRAALRKTLLGFGVLPGLAAGPTLAQAPRPIRLLALGDSLTAGYGLPAGQGFVPRLQAALDARSGAPRPVRVLDGGVSGDTTAGGLARLDWALADNPDCVIVELGGNDGLRGLPPAGTYRNLAAILDRLAARRLPALLAGMLAPPNLGADFGREFAEVFHRLARERPELVFYPFFLEGVAGDPALNQADRIHPNAAGVAEIVRRILPAVEALLAKVPAGPAAGARG
ncbi:MAG: arylesterase [Acetobacteraceae bacterium]|nr:arylesterase [Acetobacteraceae bacterium]